MGIINQCMLNDQKDRIPSQIGSHYEFPGDLEYYQKKFQNSPLFNDYLQGQAYRTQVIQPSQKNSSLFNKMVNCSQPPSQFFDKFTIFKQQQSQVKMQPYCPPKIRRTNHCQSQTVHRPKTPRRGGLPQSYKPMKNQKDEMHINANQETLLTEV